jgi:hypothetical protein
MVSFPTDCALSMACKASEFLTFIKQTSHPTQHFQCQVSPLKAMLVTRLQITDDTIHEHGVTAGVKTGRRNRNPASTVRSRRLERNKRVSRCLACQADFRP